MENAFYERKMDKLGRVVIPKELRKELNLCPENTVLFSAEKDQIILAKKEEYCCFCGDKCDLIEFEKHFICKKCLRRIKKGSI